MTYQPVKTDDGLEIRDDEGNVIWGPSEEHSWPPNEDIADAIISDASISDPTKSVLKLLTGNVDIQDETSDPE